MNSYSAENCRAAAAVCVDPKAISEVKYFESNTVLTEPSPLSSGSVPRQCDFDHLAATASESDSGHADYSISGLGMPGQDAYPSSINNEGAIVGRFGDIFTAHAFMLSSKDIVDLGANGGKTSSALAVNKFNHVVGDYRDGSNFFGFYAKGSSMIKLGTLGGAWSGAVSINDSDQIVGWALTSKGRSAFIFEKGVMTDLNDLLPEKSRQKFQSATAINNSSQIAGLIRTEKNHFHAFVLEKQSIKDLGTIGGEDSLPTRINDNGLIVGGSTTEKGDLHAFLYKNGDMIDIDNVESRMSIAASINSKGEIVGTYRNNEKYKGNTAFGSPFNIAAGDHAFLFKNGHFTDLDSLIDKATGWELGDAIAINDRGQIVGLGWHHGTVQAFLLTPAFAH